MPRESRRETLGERVGMTGSPSRLCAHLKRRTFLVINNTGKQSFNSSFIKRGTGKKKKKGGEICGKIPSLFSRVVFLASRIPFALSTSLQLVEIFLRLPDREDIVCATPTSPPLTVMASDERDAAAAAARPPPALPTLAGGTPGSMRRSALPPVTHDIMLRVARGERTPRAPCWAMRQAGR
jgi:hypothetical protein